MEAPEAGWLSLGPALVTIVLAFATRQVLPALLAGVLTGSAVLMIGGESLAEANPVDRFLFPAIGSESYARILLIYLWSLGGLIGIWERTGGAEHFARTMGARLVRGPRSSLGFAWLMGVVFHQGGTVSTVLAGTTVKPVNDAHCVSHEELAYVVDSTASPVATIVPFNAWPAYVAALVAGTIPLLPDEAAAYGFFLSSIPFNFYALLAVLSTLMLSIGWLPWMGPGLRAARERARSSGDCDRPGAEPLLPSNASVTETAEGYAPSLADFLVPIGVLLGTAILPFVLLGENLIDEAFPLCALSAMVVAGARGMPLREVVDAFVSGCQSMTIGALVLGLAVTLGTVSREVGTAAFVVNAVGQDIPPWALPALLTLLCMGIAFATGTSWGTYAVVFPIAMPLAWALSQEPLFVQVCFGAVLGGAVFGDQCSPISDTTILSSMFTGCDMMDHVRTQLFPAICAAGIGAALSTLTAMLAV